MSIETGVSACPHGNHDSLRADRRRFDAATIPQGIYDDGEERLALGKCGKCGSQIAFVEPTSGRREVVRLPRPAAVLGGSGIVLGDGR